MEQIPTAEELASLNNINDPQENRKASKAMIQFAKLHVKAALKAASDKADIYTQTYSSPHSEQWTKHVDKKSILSAYPLENIK